MSNLCYVESLNEPRERRKKVASGKPQGAATGKGYQKIPKPCKGGRSVRPYRTRTHFSLPLPVAALRLPLATFFRRSRGSLIGFSNTANDLLHTAVV